MFQYVLLFLTLIVVPFKSLWAVNIDHKLWDELLKAHVIDVRGGSSTEVNYDAMAQDQGKLKQYLKQLSQVTQTQFNDWNKEQQLAFLINAYNAWTIEFILTAWPKIKSIKDLGGFLSSPWKKKFIFLLGETRSLDNIEHHLIRGNDRYKDSRIHFAVNCASIGCPSLRAEAFKAEQLENQLDEQTRFFLEDSTRNRVKNKIIQLSSIFKWYRGDFEKGWLGHHRLEDFLIEYSTALQLSDQMILNLKSGRADIEFLEYNWKLNSKSSSH